MRRGIQSLLAAAALALGSFAAPASAAPGDPFFVFVPPPASTQPITPAPTGYFEGPCGLAVDSAGNFYVADYYHHAIDVYNGNANYSKSATGATGYVTQLANEDPSDGPCGMALDSTNRLYVNNFDRNVVGFGASPAFGFGATIAGVGVDDTHPSGVAVDLATNNVYVDQRTYITAYSSSGAQLMDGGNPLKIGVGSLGEGFGLAIDNNGRLYVPDAADNTVKVYKPATSKTTPVLTITGPPGGFTSLRHAAIAVDRSSGNVYVVDNLQPQYTEKPTAQIEVFNSLGTYLGVLKYRIVDALPAGLAVDNSSPSNKGRVYVTSGNTNQAGIYAYTAGSQIVESLPPSVALSVKAAGSGAGVIISDLGGIECDSSCDAEIRAGATATLTATPDPGSEFSGWEGGDCTGPSPTCEVEVGEATQVSADFRALPPPSPRGQGGAQASGVTQRGNLRVNLDGKLAPQKLPRKGVAPIAVSVGWGISTTDGSAPPKLERLKIEINRHGLFNSAGLPLCEVAKIQPASSSRALANCRSALVGQGSFSAQVSLGGQEAYETTGRLLLFNGQSHGKPVLFGQIYAAHPLATSFVIPFKLKNLSHGTYGTELSAVLPPSLRSWGNLTGIKMKISRRYSYEGHSRSYVSAGCPAPKGFGKVPFPLARASFAFVGGAEISSSLTQVCKVRG